MLPPPKAFALTGDRGKGSNDNMADCQALAA